MSASARSCTEGSGACPNTRYSGRSKNTPDQRREVKDRRIAMVYSTAAQMTGSSTGENRIMQRSLRSEIQRLRLAGLFDLRARDSEVFQGLHQWGKRPPLTDKTIARESSDQSSGRMGLTRITGSTVPCFDPVRKAARDRPDCSCTVSLLERKLHWREYDIA